VITGDLDRALATAIGSAGTWRPAPPGAACGVHTYVTTIAFWLASQGTSEVSTTAMSGNVPALSASTIFWWNSPNLIAVRLIWTCGCSCW